jgi:hypothetical protein
MQEAYDIQLWRCADTPARSLRPTGRSLMERNVYLTAFEPGSGKSALALGVM